MRKLFSTTLFYHASNDPRVVLLTGDLGYKMWDEFRDHMPGQFYNCGASEQAMLDIAVGLAYSGQIPFVYTITPFFYRALETIRTYIIHEKLHVVLVGSGRGTDYAHDGYSHNAEGVPGFMRLLGIKTYYPTLDEVEETVNMAVWQDEPAFVSLSR